MHVFLYPKVNPKVVYGMMIIWLEPYQYVGRIRENCFKNNWETRVGAYLPIYVKFALWTTRLLINNQLFPEACTPRWRLTTIEKGLEKVLGGEARYCSKAGKHKKPKSSLSPFTLWRDCILWGLKFRLTQMQAINDDWSDFLLVMGNHAALLLWMARVQCPWYELGV